MLPIRDIEFKPNSIIKVLGVGGGGCNAANFLYNQNVNDITFLVCNTDRQALEKSPIPAKLQLGKGLGAGGDPRAALQAAEESRDNIREALSDGTQMVFITAGMGGGTGTGASPVVAEIAQELGILTVGIVTIPFAFEGKRIIRKALTGIARLAHHVDALLVINNEKLRLIFPDFDLPNAFSKSDEVVSNAAKSIAEIITVHGYINTDFQDVYNTMRNGKVAIMNVGRSSDKEGGRISEAIKQALTSPLVNNTNVQGARRILLNFYCSHEHAIRMTELDQINAFIEKVGDDVEVKWGATYDDELGEEVRVTLIATGYPVNNIPGIEEAEREQVAQEEAKKSQQEEETKTITIDEAITSYYGVSEEEPQEDKNEAKIENEEEESEEVAENQEATDETAEEVAAEEDNTEGDNVIDFGIEEPKANVLDIDLDSLDLEPKVEAPTDPTDTDNTPAWLRRLRH